MTTTGEDGQLLVEEKKEEQQRARVETRVISCPVCECEITSDGVGVKKHSEKWEKLQQDSRDKKELASELRKLRAEAGGTDKGKADGGQAKAPGEQAHTDAPAAPQRGRRGFVFRQE